MLLTGWTKEITRAECRPETQTLHCIARLKENVGVAIPYLNAVLGGYTYIKEPPSVTFRSQGQREINETWDRRDEITPSFQAAPRPQVFQILRLLPKTNCGKCGQPTCMVFASLAMDGGKSADDCTELMPEEKKGLAEYLGKFRFDW